MARILEEKPPGGGGATGIRGLLRDRCPEVVPGSVEFEMAVLRLGSATSWQSLMVELLGNGTRVDFGVALRLARGLRVNHRSAQRLRQAFIKSYEEHGFKVPKPGVQALVRAGIQLPKKSLAGKALEWLKGR